MLRPLARGAGKADGHEGHLSDMLIHPVLPAMLGALGIPLDHLVPSEDGETVSRTDRADGRHWRVERIAGRDGHVDHVIESRPREVHGIRRISTIGGRLEIDVHPGRALPETIVTSLPGRTLGQLLEVDGPGRDLRIDAVSPKIMGADGIVPLHVGFQMMEYAPLERGDDASEKGEKTKE